MNVNELSLYCKQILVFHFCCTMMMFSSPILKSLLSPTQEVVSKGNQGYARAPMMHLSTYDLSFPKNTVNFKFLIINIRDGCQWQPMMHLLISMSLLWAPMVLLWDPHCGLIGPNGPSTCPYSLCGLSYVTSTTPMLLWTPCGFT